MGYEKKRVIAHSVGESENVATIAWVGYQPPPVLASWNTVDDDLAQAGAPKLEAFLRDLQAGSHNPGHTTALFGHSYGSLLSGIALKDGASSLVDNAVLYGSPGFDATSPAKLGMNDHNFFVMTTPDDPIRYPARLAPLHGWGSDGADTIGTVGRQGTLHGWGSDPNEIIAGSPTATASPICRPTRDPLRWVITRPPPAGTRNTAKTRCNG